MVKSITASRDASICNNSHTKRNFTSFFSDGKSVDAMINSRVRRYEDKRMLSRLDAAHIKSR